MAVSDTKPEEQPFFVRDAAFLRLFNEIKDHVSQPLDRLYMLYQFARYANAKGGDVAEVGVYKGGTARLIARVCSAKPVHLFDTFTGIPHSDSSIDIHRQGDFADTSLEMVQEFLADLPNVVFHAGIFPETAQSVTNRRYALAHFDADTYATTKDCLTFFGDRMVEGGVMLFDDWEWRGCPGVKKAVMEFVRRRREVPIVTTNYQCVLMKP